MQRLAVSLLQQFYRNNCPNIRSTKITGNNSSAVPPRVARRRRAAPIDRISLGVARRSTPWIDCCKTPTHGIPGEIPSGRGREDGGHTTKWLYMVRRRYFWLQYPAQKYRSEYLSGINAKTKYSGARETYPQPRCTPRRTIRNPAVRSCPPAPTCGPQ